MTASSKPKSSRDKVRAHRKRLRAQGLRPIQMWVPDTRAADIAAEAHRESLPSPTVLTRLRTRPSSTRSRPRLTSEAGRDLDRLRRTGLRRQAAARGYDPGDRYDATASMMVDKITTVPKTRLGYRLGVLDAEDVTQLNRAIVVFLGVAG